MSRSEKAPWFPLASRSLPPQILALRRRRAGVWSPCVYQAPANFIIPNLPTEFPFGIRYENTRKILKGSYRNTESVSLVFRILTIVALSRLSHGAPLAFIDDDTPPIFFTSSLLCIIPQEYEGTNSPPTFIPANLCTMLASRDPLDVNQPERQKDCRCRNK